MTKITGLQRRILDSISAFLFLVCCAGLIGGPNHVQGTEWGYTDSNGPEVWCKILPNHECCPTNHRQSPIDINLKTVKRLPNEKYNEVLLYNYNEQPAQATLTNNGNSVVVKLNGMKQRPYVRLRSQKTNYFLDSFHFHWGENDRKGSEHTLNGKRSPLEMHIVHYNSKYNSFDEARKHEDGLVVLSILFEISGEDNDNFDNIFTSLKQVVMENAVKNTIDRPFTMASLLPEGFQKMYAYLGSLTTPPCSESVKWVIFETKNKISEKQINMLRELEFNDSTTKKPEKLENNFRPTQKPYNRKVFEINGRVIS